ncbi:MAG: hypothetical protein V1918_02820 [Planctomycetota bacterium]
MNTEPAPSCRCRPGWILRILPPLAGWSLLAILLWRVAPLVAPLPYPVMAVVSMALFFLTTLLYLYLVCREGAFSRGAAWAAFGALAFNFLLSFLLQPDGGVSLARSMLLLFSAPVLGELLSRIVDRRTFLLPVLVVAAFADGWSVFFGLTKRLVASGAVGHVVVSYPVAQETATLPVPIIGVVDWVFLAFLIGAVQRFRLRMWKLVPAVVLGIGGGWAAMAFLGRPVPLLISIGLGFGFLYCRDICPSWEEVRTTALFLAVLAALFVLIEWAGRLWPGPPLEEGPPIAAEKSGSTGAYEEAPPSSGAAGAGSTP